VLPSLHRVPAGAGGSEAGVARRDATRETGGVMLGSVECIVQKNINDCAIAALAMILGQPYRKVSDVALKLCIDPHTVGMDDHDINRVAAKFKAKFKLHMLMNPGVAPRVLEDHPTGLLTVIRGKKDAHVVALFQGVVINPADALIWDLDTYVLHGGWKLWLLQERIK